MTRKKIPLNPDRPRVREIWDYYAASTKALKLYQKELLDSLANENVQSDSNEARFMPKSEVFDLLESYYTELSQEVVLTLSSIFEAELRLDYQHRVRNRFKDDISKSFRVLHKKHGERIRMETLLNVWKKRYSECGRHISLFERLILFRHWLAHGRYWINKSDEFTPELSLTCADNLFTSLPNFDTWESIDQPNT